jgi:isoquinoline 1-oxidoreductase beta subunit
VAARQAWLRRRRAPLFLAPTHHSLRKRAHKLQSIDQLVAAPVLGLKPEQIKINTLLGGGSFGRRGKPLGDWTVELAEVAKAINGRAPVRVVWTREDDLRGGFYGPMA